MTIGHDQFWGIMRTLPGEAYHEKLVNFEGVLSNHGHDLRSFCHGVFGDTRFHDWPIRKADFTVELLTDRLSPISWRFIRDKLRTLAYLTDRRHPEEYAFDIVLNWLAEELIIGEIEGYAGEGVSVKLVGIDSERELLSLNIRAKADIEILRNGYPLLIDIFADHKGTWVKNGYMDLKRGKVNHFNKGELDYVLGLDLQNSGWYLVDSSQVVGLEFSPNPAMGGTLTVRVPIGEPMSIREIVRILCASDQSVR